MRFCVAVRENGSVSDSRACYCDCFPLLLNRASRSCPLWVRAIICQSALLSASFQQSVHLANFARKYTLTGTIWSCTARAFNLLSPLWVEIFAHFCFPAADEPRTNLRRRHVTSRLSATRQRVVSSPVQIPRFRPSFSGVKEYVVGVFTRVFHF